ncbi:hypothetical protein N781_04950 [Pontibacillus halophilus JSM 076056 = DSM 19796]|uniref:Metal ABC transporter ATPase n=1 Tax=Pontibacillus halophilus JSM 076056 = DSM 19796 TaxID=1385510 RepID=A0A0A5I5Q1_9BACI|nr:hypothetical protein [Pontibacillus halophilus]KGX91157.1 hypothetical protein N781_04950 [Pontibacillus halophilus JSM 076056 = DSM 19796]
MLSKVKQAIFLRRIEKMLARYQITVKHFIPGRVRLSSPYWQGNSKIVHILLPVLQCEERIYSVRHTPETGTILVEFDSSKDVTEEQIETWFNKVQKVHNDVISKEVLLP